MIARSNKLPAAHAGLIFKSKFLEAKNISVYEAAIKMNMSQSNLSKFCKGKLNVTAPFATQLFKITGISVEFWMNIQKSYDLYSAGNLARYR